MTIGTLTSLGGVLLLASATVAAVALVVAHRREWFGWRKDPDEPAPAEPLTSLLLVGLGAAFLWGYVVPGVISASVHGTTPPGIARSLLYFLTGTIPGIGTILILQVLRPKGSGSLGLSPSHLVAAGRSALVGSLVIVPLILWVNVLCAITYSLLHYTHPSEHALLKLLGDTSQPGIRAMVIFAAVVVAPLFEELLFRGHIQSLVRQATGAPWPAVLAATVLFTAVHDRWSWPPIFVLSICLGAIYERTRNLWVCILIHAAFNAVSTTIFLVGARSG